MGWKFNERRTLHDYRAQNLKASSGARTLTSSTHTKRRTTKRITVQFPQDLQDQTSVSSASRHPQTCADEQGASPGHRHDSPPFLRSRLRLTYLMVLSLLGSVRVTISSRPEPSLLHLPGRAQLVVSSRINSRKREPLSLSGMRTNNDTRRHPCLVPPLVMELRLTHNL